MAQDAGIDIDMDAELARMQAQAAGLEQPDEPGEVVDGEVIAKHKTVPFLGKEFRIADKIGAMPLLKFSMYADMAVQDPKAMAAMYAMLRDCIWPGTPACGECEACQDEDETACASYDQGDWRAFEDHAMEQRAEAEDLLDVITKTMELMAGRPTARPSRSRTGPRAISGGSTGRSSGKRAKGSRR
jgi:hypothetical protein